MEGQADRDGSRKRVEKGEMKAYMSTRLQFESLDRLEFVSLRYENPGTFVHPDGPTQHLSIFNDDRKSRASTRSRQASRLIVFAPVLTVTTGGEPRVGTVQYENTIDDEFHGRSENLFPSLLPFSLSNYSFSIPDSHFRSSTPR